MESSNSSSKNLTTAINETIATQAPDSCFSFRNDVYLEIGDSTAPFIVNAALNVALSIVTTIANILVFPAIRKSTSLHLPSKLLLCGLVLTDLAVGLTAQPLFAVFLVFKVKDVSGSAGIVCILIASFAITGTTMIIASVGTMTLISVDRYIAFHFHLRYKEIVTAKRVVVALVVVWLQSVFIPSTLLWNSKLLYNYIILVGGSFSFLVTTLAYIKIYHGLRHQHGHQVQDQAQVQAQQQAGNTLNVAKYRRSASNMLWIYCVFILCYLPYILTLIAPVGRLSVFFACAQYYTMTLGFLNSCLNPLMYCYRLPEIRADVLKRLRKICGQSPQQ